MIYAELDGYEPSGKIGDLLFGNGVYTDYTYNAKTARLTRILTAQDTTPAAPVYMKRDYTYSFAGDIESIANENGFIHTYTYDSLHRLTSEESTDPNLVSQILKLDLAYDSGPLHASSSVKVNNGTEQIYQTDANGNMDSFPDLTDPASTALREIAYNADNMPDNIKRDTGAVPQLLASFLYDGYGKRAQKTANGTITYYIGDHYEIKNGIGVKYIFAGNLRVAMVKNGTVTYFHKDHLGSSTLTTNATGNIVESADYMPYGGKRNSAATIGSSNYHFTDQEWEPETGLYNYDARLYDPVIGRFVSADMIVQGGGIDPQMLNRFAYVRNNPLIYVDPSGHYLDSS
ncbi:MAG: hypothetical protein HKM93_03005, partial [Desulfobacteraceae bacterium]|nr:hypothetical protein [Desulfobacteraceae bacterium]